MRHRATLAELETKRQSYMKLGLVESVKLVERKIAVLKAQGERLKAYQFKQKGGSA